MASNPTRLSVNRGRGDSNRSFGLLLTGALILVGLWPWLVEGSVSPTPRGWALAGAAAALAAAFLKPELLSPLTRAWLAFGHLLSRVVGPAVMGIVFFAVVTPLALAMRAVGRDPMRRRFEPGAPTYWIRREPGPEPDTMRNPF